MSGMMMNGLIMDGAPTGLTPAGMTFTPNVPGLISASIIGPSLNGTVAGAGIPQASLTAQDQEAVRNAKIATIVNVLAPRLGWVSQSGMERASKRVKLEYMWEDDAPTMVGAVDKSRQRTISIAGDGVLVEVQFRGDVVQEVSLGYPEHGAGVGGFAAEGSAVLKEALRGTDEETSYVALDNFTRDLEALARMDKLSGRGVSAFDAVDGIRVTLDRIWEHEVKRIRESQGGQQVSEEEAERVVLCRGSGRPRMHAGRRIGLSLQYWMSRHRVTPEDRHHRQDEMDVEQEEDVRSGIEDDREIHALIIECEAQASEVFPSVRVSTEWISATVFAPAMEPFVGSPNSTPPFPSRLDWEDPPLTYLDDAPAQTVTSDNPLDASTLPSTLPPLRFVAQLSAPLILPLQVAMQVLSSVGAPIPPEILQQQQVQNTYELLLLLDLLQPGTLYTDTFTKEFTGCTLSGVEKRIRHSYTLFPLQPVLGYKLTEVTFSHPRQLIDILPVLRQWTLVGQMIRRCFTAPLPHGRGSGASAMGSDGDNRSKRENRDSAFHEQTTVGRAVKEEDMIPDDDEDSDSNSDEEYETLEEELASMVAPQKPRNSITSSSSGAAAPSNQARGHKPSKMQSSLPIDISLSIPVSTEGPPTLRVIYPSSSFSSPFDDDDDDDNSNNDSQQQQQPQPFSFSFSVLGSGVIDVEHVSHAGRGLLAKMSDDGRKKEIVRTALEISEDIGTTVACLCASLPLPPPPPPPSLPSNDAMER